MKPLQWDKGSVAVISDKRNIVIRGIFLEQEIEMKLKAITYN